MNPRALRSASRAVTTIVFAATFVYACGDSGGGNSIVVTDDAGSGTTKKDGAAGDSAVVDLDSSASTDTGKAKDAGHDAADAGWPDCLSQPLGVPSKTIADVWSDSAATPTQVWISGATVTAVSRGACSAGQACQIYVQSAQTFASLAAGAQQAIKIAVSSTTASHFTTVAVGDTVDVLAWGWRYDLDGLNEILLQVNAGLPGCTNKVGTGLATPIAGVTLSALTRASYEVYGPLLVTASTISGKAQVSATETFGLYPSGLDGGFPDGGGSDIVSLSPFFLSGATFTNPPIVPSVINVFTSVTGVFGLFTPIADGGAPTYLELYPRANADIVK